MRTVFLILLSVIFFKNYAQNNPALSYEMHLQYSLGAYLNTPFSNVRMAGVKWQNKDTAATVSYLEAAVQQGLFDSSMITGSSNLKGAVSLEMWNRISRGVIKNGEAISKPQNLKIYSDDVYRFLKLYPQILKKDGDALLWKEYIAKGTTGLKTFYNVRMNSRPDGVVNTIRKKRNFYAGLETLARSLPVFEAQIKTAAQKLELIYPAAVFPPIYFLVGI